MIAQSRRITKRTTDWENDMPQLNKLTDRKIKSGLKPGRYGDGGCLFLRVKESGSKSFAFMSDLTFPMGKRRVQYGLGGYPTVSLALAREKATDLRLRVREPEFRARLENGVSIRELLMEEGRREAAAQEGEVPTFGEYSRQWMDKNLDSKTTNLKARQQWYSTLETYAGPINNMHINKIGVAEVLECIEPIWQSKNVTARRVQQRIATILGAAKVQGLRSGDNPAQWKDNIEHALPAPKRVRKHHKAMPYADLPAFWARLKNKQTLAAVALQFVILTTARSVEGRGARWEELDLVNKIWTLPPERMKARKEHQVPLSGKAILILQSMKVVSEGPYVFHSTGQGGFVTETAVRNLMKEMQSDGTIHGFRSAFRDWAGNNTEFPRELIEESLAHQLGSVEAAYRRGKAIERRREVMEAWANFVSA